MTTSNIIIQRLIEHYGSLKKPAPPKFTPADIEAAWYSVGKFLEPEFVFDKTSKEMYPRLFGQTSKGVCFSGSKGIGKTLNLDIFCRLNTELNQVKTEAWEVTELETQYKASGAVLLDQLGKIPALVINDCGVESKAFIDFGTPRNLIADLLLLRYRAFQQFKYKTYISSNMNWENLKTHYGPRLADRMKEMFIPMELKGESKRK